MADAVAAVAASLGPPGCVATLVLPADVSWLEIGDDAVAKAALQELADAGRRSVGEQRRGGGRSPRVLRSGEPTALLLGGSALVRERPSSPPAV